MKRMVLATLCLAATAVYADDEGEEIIDETVIRLSEMEVINVTSEKKPVASEETLDADIEAILDEAEALEEDEAGE